MIRTQISFEDQQFAELTRRAAEEGVSMAAFVRQAVDAQLGARGDERRRRSRLALSAIGRLRGAPGERIGADHDRYLDEAFDER